MDFLKLLIALVLLNSISSKVPLEMRNTENIDVYTFNLTQHFQQWLNNNGYTDFDFAGKPGFSFGGKTHDSEVLNNTPVIFIHGNTDLAAVWNNSYIYFMQQGYKNSEMYAITYGPHDQSISRQQYFSYEFLHRTKSFIEAVKNYTGSDKINLVCHSMGVTLGRKAIKGGTGWDMQYSQSGLYDLGPPLTYIDTFVGISGGNYGLAGCFNDPGEYVCNGKTGYFPGELIFGLGPYGVSEFLVSLNTNPMKEAVHIYSMYSYGDELIGFGCVVWGRITCDIPNQEGSKTYLTLSHYNSKNDTFVAQYQMVKNHVII